MMVTIPTRLWRRAPLWRAALSLAIPATALAILYRPHPSPTWTAEPRAFQSPPPSGPGSRLSSSQPTIPDVLPTEAAPSFPIPPPPPKHMTSEQRSAEFAQSDAPYFRVPPWTFTDLDDWNGLAAKEAAIRPVFSGSVPVRHLAVPLPPGDWTVVSVGPEPVRGTSTANGVLLARLDGHAATGFVLVRVGNPGPASPEPNPMCAYPRRYVRMILSPPSKAGEECWFIAQAVGPFLSWDMVLDPPALGIGLKTMKIRGDQLPVLLVGATYFHASSKGWFETTYFFDPLANDVREGGPFGGWKPEAGLNDPTLQAFLGKMAAWMKGLLPLLEHQGSSPIPPSVIGAVNRNAPV